MNWEPFVTHLRRNAVLIGAVAVAISLLVMLGATVLVLGKVDSGARLARTAASSAQAAAQSTKKLLTEYQKAAQAQAARQAAVTKNEATYVNQLIARLETDIENADHRDRVRTLGQLEAQLRTVESAVQAVCVATHARC